VLFWAVDMETAKRTASGRIHGWLPPPLEHPRHHTAIGDLVHLIGEVDGAEGGLEALDVPMREPLVFRSESWFFGRHARKLPASTAPVGWVSRL